MMHGHCSPDHGLIILYICIGLGIGLVLGNLTKL